MLQNSFKLVFLDDFFRQKVNCFKKITNQIHSFQLNIFLLFFYRCSEFLTVIWLSVFLFISLCWQTEIPNFQSIIFFLLLSFNRIERVFFFGGKTYVWSFANIGAYVLLIETLLDTNVSKRMLESRSTGIGRTWASVKVNPSN